MKDKGLRVKLARNDEGVIGGMIQYLPIEHFYLQGQDLHFILCIWVHGHNQGRGDFRKQGMGRALLLRTGPPPSFDKIKVLIEKRVKKLS
jgi:hypothetical protein